MKNQPEFCPLDPKIKGGNELVREMIRQYKVMYKNRKAMMEIINKY